jgi:pSer/pThr/pTyr-binding forkhead associated (FHA) protein
MTKCPFCHFDNEDGAAYCEQCKSDLSVVTPEPVGVAHATPEPVRPVAAIPIAAAHSSLPAAEPVVFEAVPVAADEVAQLPVAAEVLPVAAEIAPAAIPEPPPPPPPPPAEVEVAPPAPEVAPPPVTPPPPVPVAAVEALADRAPAPPLAPAQAVGLPQGAQPRLLVLRGQKRNVEYPLYDGLNFVGRADDKPVDIDLEDQEPPDRVWCSRQHCCISFEGSKLEIEDLNSANGTYVNRQRIYPGQKRELHVTDIVQIGNVQLRVIV